MKYLFLRHQIKDYLVRSNNQNSQNRVSLWYQHFPPYWSGQEF